MPRTKYCVKNITDKSTHRLISSAVLPPKRDVKINMEPPKIERKKSKYDFSSKYDPSWCKKVLEYGAQGMSTNTIALKLGVSHNCMFMWARKLPEFRQALDAAQELSKGWWEEMGRLNLENRNFNNTLYMMNMQNRFGWHRYIDPNTPVLINNQIQQNVTNENTVKIDYSKLSNDELKHLDQLITKSIDRN